MGDIGGTAELPPTAAVIDNGQLISTGENTSRIDVGRLLQKDGTVVLRERGGEIIIEP
jgi:hypothetical protein